MTKNISGFSKLSKEEKINWLVNTYFDKDKNATQVLKRYWNTDEKLQQLHDDFIENSVSNFYFPLGVAPNFLINDRFYTLPMAIEESSVVAAASKSAKYWSERGGFRTKVLSEEKVGQVHFLFNGTSQKLVNFFNKKKAELLAKTDAITEKMRARGGGITDIKLLDKTSLIPNYYQLHIQFNTIDAMGANFINSCLECLAQELKILANDYSPFSSSEKEIEIVMSILSNYTPSCLVRAEVSCPIDKLGTIEGFAPHTFAEKFIKAVEIAEKEPYRAVTHNKGIMNGVDALVIATGNDFRAVEAGVHAYAARSGTYSSLSKAYLENNQFHFSLEIPLAIGTVGGVTQLHPLVKWSLKLLGNPSAKELMQIIASAGLAQNFAAVGSLVTSGIQKGHMKMHLLNILNQLNADSKQKEEAVLFFKNRNISFQEVQNFLEQTKKA